MRAAISICLVLFCLCAAAQAGAFDDDFSGAGFSSQWMYLADSPSELWLSQTNGVAEVGTNGGTDPANDALLLSDPMAGFVISTAQDFTMTVDFQFARTQWTGTGTLSMTFGIGADLNGENSAAVGYTQSSDATLQDGVSVAYRIDDVQTSVPLGFAYGDVDDNGTFTIHYDAAGDDLTFITTQSLTLFGNPTSSSWTLEDTVRGIWGADTVFAALGARGAGINVADGSATFDNFTFTPEPTSLTLLGLGAMALLRRRRGRFG
jgi:hypothetical protein